MKLANNAMLGCMFVNYTDICKHIMFTDYHGTSVGFHFYVRPKPLWHEKWINKYNMRVLKETLLFDHVCLVHYFAF